MPNPSTSTSLRAVFTFYSDIVTLTSEGDSLVSDDKRHGLGTTASSLLKVMFGSIMRLALPEGRDAVASQEPPSSFKSSTPLDSTTSLPPIAAPEETASHRKPPSTGVVAQGALRKPTPTTAAPSAPSGGDDGGDDSRGDGDAHQKNTLTKYIPETGYFLAGAAAGGISRTATAPLDRLKVYLLVDTRTTANDTLKAAKKGQPLQALKHGGRTFFLAVSDIWKSGGPRAFFAGMSHHVPSLGVYQLTN